MFVLCAHRWYNSGKPTSSRTTSDSLDITGLSEQEINSYFDSAASFLPGITDRVDEVVLLRLYGLYKMASVGPPTDEDQPNFYDIRGRKKFNAWNGSKHLSKAEAMTNYIQEIHALGLGWDPNTTVTRQAFGKVPSRPAVQQEEVEKVDSAEALWFLSCQNGDLEVAGKLFNRDPMLLNARDRATELTALQWAIDKGSIVSAKWLIDKGADVNIQDPDGNTPLHYAAYCCQFDIAKYLLSHGADPTIRNEDENTPRDCAETVELRDLLEVSSI